MAVINAKASSPFPLIHKLCPYFPGVFKGNGLRLFFWLRHYQKRKNLNRFYKHVIDVTIPFDKNGFNTTQKTTKKKIGKTTKKKQIVISREKPDDSSIFFDSSSEGRSTKTTKKKRKKTTKNSLAFEILMYLYVNPRLSRMDLCTIFHKKADTIQYHLNGLKRDGYIQRIGADRGGYWKIIKKPGDLE